MNMLRDGHSLIGGDWVAGGGADLKSLSPASGEVVWQGCAATPDQVQEAFDAARSAFEDWSARPLEARIEVLQVYAELCRTQKDDLAQAISSDTGKPMWDALGEAAAIAGKVDISINAYAERTGDREVTAGAIRTRLEHRPHGVMAVFGPYNFPGHLPNGHIVPALLAGNSVIFKPSSQTPQAAEVMARLWQEAGLPAGVLNVLHGTREMAQAIIDHPGLDGLLMTGSVATGITLTKALAERPNVILALEMGGNNPLIYWGADDVRAASLLTVQSAYISSGQRCTCARRLMVPDNATGQAFLDDLAQVIDGINVGRPDAEPQPFMGPVISEGAVGDVLRAQADLEARGGTVIRRAESLPLGDCFVSPGLIDVTDVPDRPDDEVFGPLLQVVRVADLDAAITEANNTRFGLAAGLISDDRAVYEEYYRRIRAGVVNWNRPTTGASSAAPFGGVGLSGNHKPAAYYAADYCAWPVASLDAAADNVVAEALPQGIDL